jgi:hypothetical protein
VAALEESIEPQEERVVLNAPRILRALCVRGRLVVEVNAFEVTAHAQRSLQLGHGTSRLLLCDEVEDLLPRNELDRCVDDCVAHLANDDHESCGCIVELGVLPDEQQDVHDGSEELGQLLKVVTAVEALEPGLKGTQVLDVVIRLEARSKDLLAELRKWRAVRRL